MKVIIAGSRTLSFNDTIAAINHCPFKHEISVVISGTAKGVDRHGEEWAKLNNIPVIQYPANWNKFGKRAGYVRNEEMAQNADALIAVWDGVSKGTKHMIDIANSYNLKVFTYNIINLTQT